VTNEGATWKHTLSHGKVARLLATNISRERTGWHAKVGVALDDWPIEIDYINLERANSRNDLARHAHAKLIAKMTSEGDDITHTEWSREQISEHILQFSYWIVNNYEKTQNKITKDDMLPVSGIEWLINPYLMVEGATTMFAPPKSGKSTIAMAMAISLTTGSNKLWEVEKKIPVLWVNLERPDNSVKLRARQLAYSLGVEGDYGLEFLHRRGHVLSVVGGSIERWVNENPDGFVFLDSISRAGMGKLVDDVTANAFTDTMHRHAPRGWCGIGHTSKLNHNEMYGNTMFQAGADIEIRLRSQVKKSELGVKMEIATSNHTTKNTSMTLAFEYVGDELVDARRADEGEYGDIVAVSAGNQTRTQRLIDAINELGGKAKVSELSEHTGIHISDVGKIMSRAIASDRGDFVKVGNGRPPEYGVASVREEEQWETTL
jgi:hypothetical protein